MMPTFDIWCEGYRATGQWSSANCLGTMKGEDFKAACVGLMELIDPESHYYCDVGNTYWGCHLFDNELDARKSFG